MPIYLASNVRVYYQAHSKHKFGELEENSICSNKEHMCNHGKQNDWELGCGNQKTWVGPSSELTIIDEIKVSTNHVVSHGLEKFQLSSFSWQLNKRLRTYHAQWYNLDDLGLYYRKKTKRNTTRNQNETPQKTKIQFVNTLKIIIFADENQ